MKARYLPLILPVAAIMVGCDANPEAPSAPSNVIVSDSDGSAPAVESGEAPTDTPE